MTDLLSGLGDDALDKAALGELHLARHQQPALALAHVLACPLHIAVEGGAIGYLHGQHTPYSVLVPGLTVPTAGHQKLEP